jgi:polysaccharide pyruvyl transferase WcaK-like protein
LIAAAFINLRQARHPAVRAYRDADVVLAVGGGYLGGPNAGINLMKAVNASAGRRAGKPVIYAGVTVTPTSRASAFILRRFMTGVVVFVRDRQSQDVLASIGVPAELTPDLCFRAPEVVSFLGKPPAVRETVTDGLAIAWTPRELESWHLSSEVRSRIESNCLDAVVELMRTRNATLLFVAQATVPGRYDDRIAISRLQEQLPADVLLRVKVAPAPESITQAMEAYAGVDVVLSSRLHATLLALACGTPSLAIGYDPKIAGVLTELGLQDRVVTADPNWTSQRIQENLVSLLDPQQRALTYAARERARNGYESLDRAIRDALEVGSAPPG